VGEEPGGQQHPADSSDIVYLGVFSIERPISMGTGPRRIWASSRGFDGHRWERRWKLRRWNMTHRSMETEISADLAKQRI